MTEMTAENFIYEGFGFPIELHNVEMLKIDNELHPIIDVKTLADLTLQALSLHQNKLTGNQLLFIRTYLMIDGIDFDKLINGSKKAITKWENFENKPANLPAKIENNLKQLLQIFIYLKMNDPKIQNQLLSSQGMFSTSQKKTPPSVSLDPDQEAASKKKKKP